MTHSLIIVLTMLFSSYTGLGATITESPVTVIEIAEDLSEADKSEILWLARIVFSETKGSEEMRLVAWVVRNRVESEYRGTTYKEVANSAHQFSGLNPSDAQYSANISMNYDTENESWKTALVVAKNVYFANSAERPFSKDVKHFYSPVSVKYAPKWAESGNLDHTVPGTYSDAPRFAFYSGVK